MKSIFYLSLTLVLYVKASYKTPGRVARQPNTLSMTTVVMQMYTRFLVTMLVEQTFNSFTPMAIRKWPVPFFTLKFSTVDLCTLRMVR